jgi:hypothetical protein
MDPTHETPRYALVVPETLESHVDRVHRGVRGRVRIEVYLVDDFGGVRRI